MPRLPRQDLPTVSPAPLPRPQASAPSATAFGAGVGQALVDVGEVLGQIATREKRKAEGVALATFDRELSQWEIENVHDPERGALARRGRDALAINDPEQGVIAKLDAWAGKRLESFGDSELVERARGLLDSRRRSIALSVLRHEAGERERLDVEETAGAIEASRSLAAAHYRDSQRVGAELERTTAHVLARAERAGWGDFEMREHLERAWTDFHLAVLDRFLAVNDAEGARVYFESAQDEIAGDRRDEIETALRGLEQTSEVQETADEIAARFGIYTEQPDVEGALKAVRGLQGEFRDDVHRRVVSAIQESDALRQRQEEEILDRARDDFEKGGGNLASVHPRDRARLPLPFLNALRLEEERRQAQTEPRQDWRAWAKFLDLDPKDLARATAADIYTAFRHRLDDQHFDAALRAHRSARESLERGVTAPADPLTFEQRLLATARKAGLAPQRGEKWSPDRAQMFDTMQLEVARRLNEAESLAGRKLTADERQKLLDQVVIEEWVVFRRGPENALEEWQHFFAGIAGFKRAQGWESEKPLFQVPAEVLEASRDAFVPIERVPADLREAWRNVAIGNGLLGTDREVGHLHLLYLQGSPDLQLLADGIRSGKAIGKEPSPLERGPTEEELSTIRRRLTTSEGIPSEVDVRRVWSAWALERSDIATDDETPEGPVAGASKSEAWNPARARPRGRHWSDRLEGTMAGIQSRVLKDAFWDPLGLLGREQATTDREGASPDQAGETNAARGR